MNGNNIKNIKNTENKITVKDFLKKYNALTNDKAKEDFVKLNIVNKYVPYGTKCDICKKIIKVTHYVAEEGKTYERFLINSPAQYMLYCLNLIKYYTTTEVDFNNSVEEFDLLNKNNLINIICEFINPREIKEFQMLLDMIEDDVFKNEYENHAFISKQVDRFETLIGTTLQPLLEIIGNNLENIDEKKLEKMLNKLVR